MQNLKDHLEELAGQIDAAETEQEALDISQKLHDAHKAIEGIRNALAFHKINAFDLCAAIDDDLEHFSAFCASESNRADGVADDLYQEAEDSRIYGSYEDQVRSTYYGGVL